MKNIFLNLIEKWKSIIQAQNKIYWRKMIEIYVTSAFSKNNSGGNKAGVVLEKACLIRAQKMKIAEKLGYSETAFVSDSDTADFKLEYFTPAEEVPLCGHATIATFAALQKLNRLDKENYTIETKAGVLKIQIKKDGLIFMEQNCPIYFEVLNPNLLFECMDLHYIDQKLPIQIVSTGLKDIMLPINSLEHLEKLQLNAKAFEAIAKLSREKDAVGIHAFAITEENGITATVRNFAPLYGINEESATGTANCALACYLFKYYKKMPQYVFEQGYHLGEASQITVKMDYHGDCIDSVSVGGYGYLICKKTLQV